MSIIKKMFQVWNPSSGISITPMDIFTFLRFM